MSCGIKDPVMLNEIEEAYYEGAIRQKPVEKIKGNLGGISPNSEWGEEDDTRLLQIIIALEGYSEWHVSNGYGDKFKDNIDWLKSLRPQKQWKPSEEQLKAIRWFLLNVPYNTHKENLSGLLEELEKL